MLRKEIDLFDPAIIRGNLYTRRGSMVSEFLINQRHMAAGRAVVNRVAAEKYLSDIQAEIEFTSKLINFFDLNK